MKPQSTHRASIMRKVSQKIQKFATDKLQETGYATVLVNSELVEK